MAEGDSDSTNSADGDSSVTDPGDNSDSTDTQEKLIPQSKVDQIVSDRLAKERKRYADYSDLKDKASKFDEQEKERLSAEERLTRERDEWKTKANELAVRHQDALKRSAVVTAASKAGANNPNVVFNLLDKSTLEVHEDGEVSGVDAAIAALRNTDQYLFGSTIQRMGDANGGVRVETSTPTAFTRSQIRDPKYYREHETDILAAMKEGRISDE